MHTQPLNPDMMSVEKAVDALDRLQTAAPPATAATLARVITLLQTLNEENAYLSALMLETPGEELPQSIARDHTNTPAIIDDGGFSITLLSGLNESLRPPLIAIRGRAELVQAGLLGHITVEQERWLQAVQDNTRRAFALLDTVQQITALHTGRTMLHSTSFPPRDLLEASYERARDKARVRQHKLILHPSGQLPRTSTDFYQALIVLNELVDNAIQYTPQNGRIELSVDTLGTHILFSVIDNGIGLSQEDLQHIGQPYWRCERQPLVRQISGTGLHLYMVRQILGRLGGELIYDGEPDKGSTFSFTLPVTQG